MSYSLDTLCSEWQSIGNGIWGIKWSRDPERSSRDPNTLIGPDISKTAGDAA